MDIYAPDSKVMIKGMVIDGIVKSVRITSNMSISYQIGWWNGDSYVVGDFSASEVSGHAEGKSKIGFK